MPCSRVNQGGVGYGKTIVILEQTLPCREVDFGLTLKFEIFWGAVGPWVGGYLGEFLLKVTINRCDSTS